MGLTIDIVSRADPGTVIASLDAVVSRSGRDELNEAAASSFSIANDDPNASAVQIGRIAIWKVDGEVAWAQLLQRKDKVTIAQGEEEEQVTVWEGRQVAAILAESVVYPSRGPDVLPVEVDRMFTWALPDYDEASYPGGWTTAVQIARQDATTPYWTGAPEPVGDTVWVDNTAYWIGSDAGDSTSAPLGVEYFRREHTIMTAGAHAIQFGAFYYGDFWVDGQHILSTGDQIGRIQQEVIDLSAGPHTFAFVVQNVANGGDDPAGGLAAVHPLNADGTLGTAVLHTDSSWSMLAFPTDGQPGMSTGEIIAAYLTQVQALGHIPEITWDFTDLLDSNLDAWIGTDHPDVQVGTLFDCATKVNTDGLTFLQELAATYVDFWVDEGLVLHVVNKGGRGTSSGVTLQPPTDPEDPTTGNLLTLKHTTVEAICNDALVAWSGGWHRVQNFPAIAAHGPKARGLSLGAQQSIIAVEAVAGGELAEFGVPQTETRCSHRALGGWPYTPGDTVLVPDEDGDLVAQRVVAIQLTDDDGVLTITPTFGTDLS